MNKKVIKKEHPVRSHMVGDGFRVQQYIPGYSKEMSSETSPFLMLDYNPRWEVPPQRAGHRPGVGYHPHRGFETVTIVYSGEIEHNDTAGNGGIIGCDEVQWMTAGSGLLHNEFMSETFAKNGGIQHLIQLWVNLPKKHKMTEPKYQSLTKDIIPEYNFEYGKVRVIAGEFLGVKGIASTFTPVELYDIRIVKDGLLDISLPDGFNTFLLVAEGEIEIDRKIGKNGDMFTLSKEGNNFSIHSLLDSKILIMSGEPIDERVVQYGPFVMNSEEEIEEAILDFQSGKMGNPNL